MNIQKIVRTLILTSVSLLSITGCSEFFVRKANTQGAFNAADVVYDKDTYPAVVLGGGVGGMTASVYLAMANVKTLLVQGGMPGGLLTQSLSVRNWPGEIESTGMAISDKLLAQARKQGVEVKAEQATALDVTKWPYTITLSEVNEPSKTRTVKALSIIIAMGACSNYLSIPGEKEYWSKGVTNCAVCEGSLYKDKVVCVIGGGNSAVEEAHYLAGIARKVIVFVRGTALRATDRRKDELMSMSNVEIVYEHAVKKIVGANDKVTDVVVLNTATKEEKTYPMDGVFLAIGFTPNTAILKNVVALDADGYITLTNDQQTSVLGVYAVGDIVDPRYKQAVTAAGDGCRAALQAHTFLMQTGYKAPHEATTLPASPAAVVAHAEKGDDIETKSVVPVIEKEEHAYAPGVVHEMRSTQEITSLVSDSKKPVVIDFYATWCGPCRAFSPLYKKLAERYTGKVTFVKVNIDNLGGVATNYRVQGVPTFVFIKDGFERDRVVGGGSSERQFAEKVESLL